MQRVPLNVFGGFRLALSADSGRFTAWNKQANAVNSSFRTAKKAQERTN